VKNPCIFILEPSGRSSLRIFMVKTYQRSEMRIASIIKDVLHDDKSRNSVLTDRYRENQKHKQVTLEFSYTQSMPYETSMVK
jgi:hypothetical protein